MSSTRSVGVSLARRFNAGITLLPVLVGLNPRSGWKHKAWGEAKRTPGSRRQENFERAKRAIAQKHNLDSRQRDVAHFVGSAPFYFNDPGVSLRSTPGFMPSPRFAGSMQTLPHTSYGVGGTFASCVGPPFGCASDTLGTSAFVPVAGVTAGVASFVGATGAVEFGVSG